MVVVALLLIFTGPWLVYLFCPVPDQLAEYRNYTITSGFALLASQLHWEFWILLLAVMSAMTHLHAGAWKSALDMWRYAKDRTSGDPSRVQQEIGAYLKIAGKPEEAEPYFRKALVLNPRLGPAMENLAGIVLQFGRTDEGYEIMQRCVEVCPNYAAGWQFWGLLLEEKGRIEEAKLAFQRAVDLTGMAPSANRLGLLAFKEQKFDEALKWFEKAREPFPDHPDFIFNHVNTLYALNRKDEGEQVRALLGGRPIQLTREMIRPEGLSC